MTKDIYMDDPWEHLLGKCNHEKKLLEGKILQFRQMLKAFVDIDADDIVAEWIEKYDEHFNITFTREGKIE